MPSSAKQKMIDGAIRLLATKGLQATSFSEVLELTGAPRGSIYYHFPGGKDQLIVAAVEAAGAKTFTLLEQKRNASALEVTEYFIDLWRQLLDYSHFRAGCSVLAVTVEATSPELLQATAKVFQSWRLQLKELFINAGVSPENATGCAALLIASTEGAVVIARAEQSIEPFELVARQLTQHIVSLT